MESNVSPPVAPTTRGRASVALASVFLSPTRAFREIAAGASWVWGFVVSLVLGVVAAFVQKPFGEVVMRARLAQMPEEHRQAAERMVGVQSTMQIVLTPVFMALMFLLSALLYLGIGRAMGLRLRFKSLFAGMCYAGVITGIGGFVIAFLNRQRAVSGDITGPEDMPRLGLDLVGGEGFVRGVLSQVNVFNIWWMVVLVYGVAVLAGRAPRQALPAALVAGCVWLLLMGLLAGLAFISPGG
jgi:hypothetical protein